MLQAPLATRHRIKSIECLVPQDDDNGRAQRYLAWLGRGLDTQYHAWRRADDERRLRHLYSENPGRIWTLWLAKSKAAGNPYEALILLREMMMGGTRGQIQTGEL